MIKSVTTPPMSPGKRLLRVAGSPGRFIKSQLREGSINSSAFSLVIASLGCGTLTIPYVYFANGIYLGTVGILFGGFLSSFTSYLLAYCAMKTGSSCYEEIALATYGRKMQMFTVFC